jgi:curved DNA-binding protein CbpA
MHFPDYYETLSVERSSSQEEIQQAYQREALQMHPLLEADEEVARQRHGATAAGRFQSLADAYYTLGDEERRRVYDAAYLRHEGIIESAQDPHRVFAEAFEEVLRPEVAAPSYLYRGVGSMSGAALGFIIGNLPGVLAGLYLGERLGEIRDKRGKSVYEVFSEMEAEKRRSILKMLWRSMVASVMPPR